MPARTKSAGYTAPVVGNRGGNVPEGVGLEGDDTLARAQLRPHSLMSLGEPGTGHTGECACHGTVGILKHCDLDSVLPGGGELETHEAGPQ